MQQSQPPGPRAEPRAAAPHTSRDGNKTAAMKQQISALCAQEAKAPGTVHIFTKILLEHMSKHFGSEPTLCGDAMIQALEALGFKFERREHPARKIFEGTEAQEKLQVFARSYVSDAMMRLAREHQADLCCYSATIPSALPTLRDITPVTFRVLEVPSELKSGTPQDVGLSLPKLPEG